jgi:hypothetical protein
MYKIITENPCYKKKAHMKCWKEEQLRKEFEREMAKWNTATI